MTRFRPVALPLVFIMALIPSLGSADTFTAHIERGDSLYRQFDNQGALQEYESAYLIGPSDFTALARMIRIHNDLGRLERTSDGGGELEYAKAIEYAELMHDLYPDRAETYFWLALTKGSMARYVGISEKVSIGKSVEESARKAIELDPQYSHAYMILGIFYRMAGDLSWLEKLVARAVFGADFQGTYEESVEMLQKSIELDPSNIFAYDELARTFRAMKQDKDALKAYQTVLSMIPQSLREKELQKSVERRLARQSTEG